MIISNKNGTFEVGASQFNFMIRNIKFNDINKHDVLRYIFVKSSGDYDKAHAILKSSKTH